MSPYVEETRVSDDCGCHRQVYRHIVLLLALVVSRPTLGGYFIALLKDSSLVSFIAVNELLRQGTIINSSTFKIHHGLEFTAGIELLQSRVSRGIEPGDQSRPLGGLVFLNGDGEFLAEIFVNLPLIPFIVAVRSLLDEGLLAHTANTSGDLTPGTSRQPAKAGMVVMPVAMQSRLNFNARFMSVPLFF